MEEDLNLSLDIFLPLRDVVFNTLRNAILTGQLKPGERLMEVHLANKLGVSRTPIREAIRKLELEGFVTMIPRKGAEVAKISEKSLKDVLEVRRALDVLIAELACERISKEELEELRLAAEEFERATVDSKKLADASDNTADITAVAKADVAFHDIIIASTRNMRLQSLVNNLAEQMYRYRFVYLTDTTIHPNLVKEHKAIYEAILKRDSKAAKEAARIHIDNQEAAILDHIRRENTVHE